MVYAPLNLPVALMAADSATVALRGAAGALTGTLTDPFEMPAWQRAAAEIANRIFSPSAKKRLMRSIAASTARTTEQVESADSHLVARWMASLYPDLPYPGAILGAPSGAAAHLASLLGVPFFSQHVLTGVRGKYDPDDTTAYVQALAPTAARVLRRNPDWEGIIHHDPLHDRFLVGTVGFLRLK
ncbi:MAG TPA: hypothetical protein VEI97_09920, partial [bacterium]|nr:hypothetical protein [bacterium]